MEGQEGLDSTLVKITDVAVLGDVAATVRARMVWARAQKCINKENFNYFGKTRVRGCEIYMSFDSNLAFSLRKHAYSNILKNLPPKKNENFQK